MADGSYCSTTWTRLAWMFGLFFGFNYLSSLLILYLLVNPLWYVFALSIYVLMSTLYEAAAKYYFPENAKGQLDLVNELRLVDIEKIPFVIERFLQLDKANVVVREDSICDSQRCVVCLDDKAAIQTLPCRHRVICGQCAWTTLKMALKQSALHTCVLCRGEIRDFNGSLFKNLVNVKWQDVKNVLDETKAM